MSARGWAGQSRFDVPLLEADAGEADIELMQYSDDPEYQERRRDAELAHFREMIRSVERTLATNVDDAYRARLIANRASWQSMIDDLERPKVWAAGVGDRKLF